MRHYVSVSLVGLCLMVGAVGPASAGEPPRQWWEMVGWDLSTVTPAAVQALLDQGTSPTARDRYGDTPLHGAAGSNKNPAVVALLLDRGADLTARNQNGNTPLHEAAESNDPAVVALLLDRGANLTARGLDGDTSLHGAAGSNKNPVVVALLLDRGADLTARDRYGDTPLHGAAGSNKNPAVVALLLDRGADLTARDHYGSTPLHWAVESNDPAVVALLLDRGADPKLQSKEGKLPVDYAAENEKLQGTDVYWRLTVGSSGAPASENLSPDVDHLPFIQALRHLETREQKLQHLLSWILARGPQNGLPEHEARHFESLLALFIFHHVDDNGVLNCQTLGENLARVMPDRYEAGRGMYWYTVPYKMFNLTVDDLCPALAGGRRSPQSSR